MATVQRSLSRRQLMIRVVSVVVGAISLWYLLGFVFPYYHARDLDGAAMQKSGQFGDSFNAVGVLFTGLALCGTIYAVILQQNALGLQLKEIAKSEEDQEQQLRIAQDTARLQTLSFFARLQIELITGATTEMQHKMWRLANFYGEQALTMVKSMGSSFDSVADILPRGGIIQMNSRDGALSLLTVIADKLERNNDFRRLMEQQVGDNESPRMHLQQAAAELEKWSENNVFLFAPEERVWVTTTPEDIRQFASQRQTPLDKPSWQAWCNDVQRFPSEIRRARRTIEELAKQKALSTLASGDVEKS
jgi:hypothetical protein